MPSTKILPALILSLALPGLALAQAKPAPAAPDLNDAEVAHVAVTANAVDIEMAKYVQARLHSADARQFAATMIADHSAVNAKAGALATRLGVTPADNAVSKSLVDGAAAARRTLEPLTGDNFDRAYLDREIGYHQAVLDALDGLLIPTTENADLKALLVQVRPAIAAHLAHAKELRAAFGSTR
jgi:putative membrane protein